ncbi:hypothetical protein DOY81_006781 [Sarcophaga bullata]|nr:hypothetical protein DOY81_006781 [Sarcophaga bullata]
MRKINNQSNNDNNNNKNNKKTTTTTRTAASIITTNNKTTQEKKSNHNTIRDSETFIIPKPSIVALVKAHVNTKEVVSSSNVPLDIS